ncbi:MAG TPA: hypothetical protein PKD78_15860, partial [Saprospiraceae bacterium]|nr:hypothetical protein [Saprospiraceae bacterium]
MASVSEYGPSVSDYRIDIKSEPLATYFNTCKSWVDTQPNMQIGGVVFFPIPTEYDAPLTPGTRVFHTLGLVLKVAVWDSLVDPQKLDYCPDDLRIYTNNAALYVGGAPPASTLEVFDHQWDLAYGDPTLFSKITGLQPGDPPSTPGAAREYDLVFLEFNKFCDLASIIVNPAYDPSAADSPYYIVTDEPGNYYFNQAPPPAAAQRGIQISRSSIDFDYTQTTPATVTSPATATRINMAKFRSLKFNPYPEPQLPNYDSRVAVAYQQGVPCPPIWQNGALSHAVRLAVSAGLKEGYIPATQEPFGLPTPPSAREQDFSFSSSYKSNPLFRWLFFLLLAA